MFEYIQIRDKTTREITGIIDNATSIIWHTVYFGVGDFEIYAQATDKHIELLQEGNYVTRPTDYDNGKYKTIGIIEHIETEEEGNMIIASGRFAKSILDRRYIYNLNGKVNSATVLEGNVELAVRILVYDNAIDCSFNSDRNITALELGARAVPTITETIVDESGVATQKQVPCDNLLTYSDTLLEEYNLGANIYLSDETNKLQYVVYKGIDRSYNNSSNNNPVIFSTEYDNLSSSKYLLDVSNKKTAALIGGEGEGLDRFYSIINGTESDLNRRETFVDASSLSKKYTDEQGTEKTYTDAEYTKMLNATGKQELATLTGTETFDGTLDVTGGVWELNTDYMLGDIVTIQDNKLGKYANVRITELTETQDENGYSVNITYKNI